MYYRICDNIALRSWVFVPHAYYKKGKLPAESLTDEEFELMKLCDGQHDITLDDQILSLMKRGLIEKCDKGTPVSEWSKLRTYNHRYFPMMLWMPTAKCNLNCIHCYNAVDNSPLMSEFSYEEAMKLLDEAEACGIEGFLIAGGEPMVHPHFMDIIRGIYERNMFVREIRTNGILLTQEILDEFKSIGCKPLMKISFDGVGTHNIIRNQDCEERTCDAISLCIENGFEVMVQMQVNRKTEHVVFETAKRVNELGVQKLRLIRTVETPRWRDHGGEDGIPMEEFYLTYSKMARDIYDYIKSLPKEDQHLRKLVVYQLVEINIEHDSYHLIPISYGEDCYRDTYPVCQDARKMVTVSATGELAPCVQMVGGMAERGIHFGNVKETPLEELLTDGKYLKNVTNNLYNLKNANEKCGSCKYFPYCAGGCRAIAALFSKKREGFLDVDPAKCLFFHGGLYPKCQKYFEGLKDTRPMPEEIYNAKPDLPEGEEMVSPTLADIID